MCNKKLCECFADIFSVLIKIVIKVVRSFFKGWSILVYRFSASTFFYLNFFTQWILCRFNYHFTPAGKRKAMKSNWKLKTINLFTRLAIPFCSISHLKKTFSHTSSLTEQKLGNREMKSTFMKFHTALVFISVCKQFNVMLLS